MKVGFGPIMQVERARTVAGVASYAVKYLHKTGQQRQVEAGNKRVRLVGFTKNWPRPPKYNLYSVGCITKMSPDEARTADLDGCAQCEGRLLAAAEHYHATGSREAYHQIRRANIYHWLRPTHLDPMFKWTVRAALAFRRSMYQARAAGRDCEADQCRAAYVAALVRLRDVHKYRSSLVLLMDWRAAGYDMEALAACA